MTLEPICVLIVDDEERFRETTAAILKRRGFRVCAVADAVQAIEVVRGDDVDVVVLDIQMPGMDGHEALREIRKVKPDLPVVMLTGHGTPESALEGLRDGVFDYLHKPCAIDVLSQKIREAHASARQGKNGIRSDEPRVRDVMIPLRSFSTVREDQTVGEVVERMLESFLRIVSTATVQDTAHRSILATDATGRVVGIITYTDLLRGLEPEYVRLLNQEPAPAGTRYRESPNFSGMFTILSRDLTTKPVREIMSEVPPRLQADANLMEAVSMMLSRHVRRLLVAESGLIVGVLREQDLVFEMAKHMQQPGAS